MPQIISRHLKTLISEFYSQKALDPNNFMGNVISNIQRTADYSAMGGTLETEIMEIT